jgi:hypothetical protein
MVSRNYISLIVAAESLMILPLLSFTIFLLLLGYSIVVVLSVIPGFGVDITMTILICINLR